MRPKGAFFKKVQRSNQHRVRNTNFRNILARNIFVVRRSSSVLQSSGIAQFPGSHVPILVTIQFGVVLLDPVLLVDHFEIGIVASKLLTYALENFLGTCLKVLNYFPEEASKSFLLSYRTG